MSGDDRAPISCDRAAARGSTFVIALSSGASPATSQRGADTSPSVRLQPDSSELGGNPTARNAVEPLGSRLGPAPPPGMDRYLFAFV
jgi:hypothetical protein